MLEHGAYPTSKNVTSSFSNLSLTLNLGLAKPDQLLQMAYHGSKIKQVSVLSWHYVSVGHVLDICFSKYNEKLGLVK